MSIAGPVRTADWDEDVASYLRANPDWLAAHPDLYRTLTPPARIHGEILADHMAAMLARERRHSGDMVVQTASVLAAGREAAAMSARVHEAVLALMTADDVAECLRAELPHVLGADVACVWSACAKDEGERRLAARLEGVLGGKDVAFRGAPEDAQALYEEAAGLAAHDVLIRLPEVGVLGLAGREPMGADTVQARLSLQFLGRAVAAALRR
jgi:hypothetical protein